MRAQLLTLDHLVQLMDPQLYLHLQSADSTNFFFFFRMFLVWYKREFEWCDVLRLWEALWTDYLSSSFHLFIAMAILEKHRDVIMDHLKHFDEVLKYSKWHTTRKQQYQIPLTFNAKSTNSPTPWNSSRSSPARSPSSTVSSAPSKPSTRKTTSLRPRPPTNGNPSKTPPPNPTKASHLSDRPAPPATAAASTRGLPGQVRRTDQSQRSSRRSSETYFARTFSGRLRPRNHLSVP